jgi:hypothetical protein
MVLRTLQIHGGKISLEDAATYLRKSEEEIKEIATELHRWRLARIYDGDTYQDTILKISQFGELAILEASGLDFDGYEKLKTQWVEDWVDWYENH